MGPEGFYKDIDCRIRRHLDISTFWHVNS